MDRSLRAALDAARTPSRAAATDPDQGAAAGPPAALRWIAGLGVIFSQHVHVAVPGEQKEVMKAPQPPLRVAFSLAALVCAPLLGQGHGFQTRQDLQTFPWWPPPIFPIP